MKNKKLIYFLGFIVLAVWGLIIYRIFYTVNQNDDDDSQTLTARPIKEPFNDFSVPKDTTHLLLNYRDPFGLIKWKDTTGKMVKNIHRQSLAPIILKPAFDWSFIQYSGYIRNPASKKLIALVTIYGKNEMLLEGETKDNVRLIKNMGDAIKIGFNGETKLIPIKSAAL